MNALRAIHERLVAALDASGNWLALLPIRALLAYEFGTAGLMKYNGSNWFGRIQDNFPFPFSVIPVDVSWFIATWFEILGAVGLAIGLFTRFWAFGLVILTFVAILGVHMPAEWHSLGDLWEGYRVTGKDGSGNFRIPLLFLAMLVPLVFAGGGRVSVDAWLSRRSRPAHLRAG